MSTTSKAPLVHCHCVYAKVVPKATKAEVLRRLGDSGRDFEAVPDLCEMAARKDPALARLAADPNTEIVACFPRAVRWLFHGAGHDLAEGIKVHNMRELGADEVCEAIGLPAAKETEA